MFVQAKDERNYHIFYEMLAGLPTHMKRAFYLQEAETYYYLNQVNADIYKCELSRHTLGTHLVLYNYVMAHGIMSC